MSHILREAGRFAMTSVRNHQRYSVCESCLLLRNGYMEISTQAAVEYHTKDNKILKRKEKKELRDKAKELQVLIRVLETWIHQQPGSSGKKPNQTESELPSEYHRLNKNNRRLTHEFDKKERLAQTEHNVAAETESIQSGSQTGSQGFRNLKKRKKVELENHSGLTNLSTPIIPTLSADTMNPFKGIGSGHDLNIGVSVQGLEPETYANKINQSVVKDKEIGDTLKLYESNVGETVEFAKSASSPECTQRRKQTVMSENVKQEPESVIKTGKETIKQKQNHRKERLKKALKEVYERKNKNIHEQKQKLNKVAFQQTKSLLAALHRRSKFTSDMKIASSGMSIKEAKGIFKYKPEADLGADINNSDHLLDVLFEKDFKKVIEDEFSEERGVVEENLEKRQDGLAAKEVVTNGTTRSTTERLPWDVEHAIRGLNREWPVGSAQETEKLEMNPDVAHEDLACVEMAGDIAPVGGYTTDQSQAQMQPKERRKDLILQQSKIDDDMILYTKQGIFNQDLLSYVEVCVCCGITTKAFEDVKMYRLKQDPECKVKDIRIYNQILRGFGKEGKSIDLACEVFSYMREDGLSPNLQTYMLCLSCVGNASGETDYKLMRALFIVQDMINEGLDVKDIFNQCTFLYNERSCVYQLLSDVIPDYEPNPPMVNVDYTGPLVEALNEMLPVDKKVETNPFTCGMTKMEIMSAAEKQFSDELNGFVKLNSVFKTHNKRARTRMEALKKVQKKWKENIKEAFTARKAELRKKAYKTQGISIYPFFCLFPDDDYVDILCKELHWWLTFSQMFSPVCSMLKRDLVERMRQRFCIQQMIDVDVFPKLYQAYSAYISQLSDPSMRIQTQRQLWAQIMQRITDGNSMDRPVVEWSDTVKQTIGNILFDIIVKGTTFDSNILSKKPENKQKAFYVVERTKYGKRTLELRPHPLISVLVNAQTDLIFPTDKMPSLCPPVPYMGPGQGGNFISTVDLVRWCTDQQIELFKDKTEEAGPVLDSLNILSTYAWKINKPVLDVVLKVFKDGGDEDLEIPILPANIPRPKKQDPSAPKTVESVKSITEYQKAVTEANSLWWTGLYKLSIANEMRDKTIWLVMNMDFRGRTYPVAPYLHHQNQDYVKALMLFAKGKPLGEDGFKWLKLHLVNLTEHKKRSSLEERLVYADEIMPDILDSAKNPLTGKKWWMTSENPWQTLAACKEVAAALKSGDPTTFVSHYPVHQDGSCNGLQHYAAMGRDVTGAKSVNLKSEGPSPADVYSDVVELVKKEIEKDIRSNSKDAKIAELCQPYLERKVIKQSIMTTVYGVTMYGAKLQIKRQLKYKEFPDEDIIAASRYLAEKTFQCLNNLFTSARKIQNWFDHCSVAIGKANQPVEWKTPLNFVCIQPYFKTRPKPPDMADKVYHYLNRKTDIMRISDVSKQKNGFAPNFVHSLDSVHMMLTSLYCYRKGLTYSSVHDSYWTHACDVEIMSKITREQFIALHSQPILQDLSDYFIDRYIDSEDLSTERCAKLRHVFSQVPKKGKFDLNDILVSPYFFS